MSTSSVHPPISVAAPIPDSRARPTIWQLIGFVTFLLVLLAPNLAAVLTGLHLLAPLTAEPDDENRVLAEAPRWPSDIGEWLQLPDRLTKLADDRFGQRRRLVWADGWLRHKLFNEAVSDQIVFGEHRRIFLGSHISDSPFSLIDEVCGATPLGGLVPELAHGIAGLLDQAVEIAPVSYYLSVPTAPALYPQDLPGWLRRRCDRFAPIPPQVLKFLGAERPDLQSRFVYPFAELVTPTGKTTSIPSDNFHWEGDGARAAVRAVAARIPGLLQRSLPSAEVVIPSDLRRHTPGVVRVHPALRLNYQAGGVEACLGADCVPSLRPFASVLTETTSYRRRDGSGPTALVVSDSFGAQFAAFLPEYFGQVVHINVAFDRLSDSERLRFRAALKDLRPDALFYVFHDAAIGLAASHASVLFQRER